MAPIYSQDKYAQTQAAAGLPDNHDYYYYDYYDYPGQGQAADQYASGAIPVPPTARLQFQPPGSSGSEMKLETGRISSYRGQPQSLPPPARSKKNYRELDDPSPFFRDLDGPLEKARDLVDNRFTKSNTGLGVGVLGAIVGGLIAREASGATTHRPRSRRRHGSDKGPLVSTIVGAAVGGLAANALEKRIEVARVKTAEKEVAWERRWGRDSRVRTIEREDDLRDTGERQARRRSSSMFYEEDADFRAVYAGPGR